MNWSQQVNVDPTEYLINLNLQICSKLIQTFFSPQNYMDL